jgi:serine-type D-Ala-D-Ala carboxypeptidase (penicillin-binding protein 5/6)
MPNRSRPTPALRIALVVLAAFGLGTGAALALNSADSERSSGGAGSAAVVTTTHAPTVTNDEAPVTTLPGSPGSPSTVSTGGASTPAVTTAPSTSASTVPPTTVAPPIVSEVPTAGVPAVDAAAYVVFDASSGRQLAASNAEEPRAVGSMQKMLTAHVVMQEGDPEHVVTVPEMQVDPKESQIGLYAGEQLSRAVLLRAMMIVSANDAARALAVDVAGSTEAFVEQMNAAAAALGMTDTAVMNPVGLDADGQHSTANDMLLLARTLMADPTFRETAARTTASLHGMTFNSPNDLLTSYPGADGIKTGHTTDAGYCLAASATRGGRQVFVVVLGSPTKQARLAAASDLLDWAFSQPA